jgi:endoglucanase
MNRNRTITTVISRIHRSTICEITMFKIFSIVLLLVFTGGLSPSHLDAQGEKIVVDQEGYRPNDSKLAFIKGIPGEKFEVVDNARRKVVFSGKFDNAGIHDQATDDVTYTIDFTRLKNPGRYFLRIPSTSTISREFTVAPDVYDSAALTSIQSFYYQRCGTEIQNGTQWHHEKCHENDAAVNDAPSRSIDVAGGWHDAGDYGKFVPTGAVSTAFLLYLYELQPWKFYDGQLRIPEAHNGIPDILDEARWELQWLLKMQRDDGGVYHKISIKKWTGEYLPQTDRDRRFLFTVSSTSTGDFAAVTALASRIFEKWDRPFARQLLRSSERAWRFLELNPMSVPPGGFHNPADVEGGEYGDDQDTDERLWSSVELFRTTHNKLYNQYFLSHYALLQGPNYAVSWQLVKNFAYYSYLSLPSRSINSRARLYIESILSYYGNYLLERIKENGYRQVLSKGQYYWGSNSVMLGYAYDLIWAYEITRSTKYLEGALDQLHYILGRNPFDKSFVTGVGDNPVHHPYHQFSMLLNSGAPVPGMVVGGPNNSSRLKGKIISDYPGKCYEDNEKNFFVNEVAINYTAPFVFISGYFSALGKPKAGSEIVGRR